MDLKTKNELQQRELDILKPELEKQRQLYYQNEDKRLKLEKSLGEAGIKLENF